MSEFLLYSLYMFAMTSVLPVSHVTSHNDGISEVTGVLFLLSYFLIAYIYDYHLLCTFLYT